MPAVSARAAEIRSGIEESKARIFSAMSDMQETVIVSRAHIEDTRELLRELDRGLPHQDAAE